jgi:hypothetical protein
LKAKYFVAENQLDLFPLFIEKALMLIRPHTYFAFIVPNSFLANENSKKLRDLILDNFSIKSITECKKEVFLDADVESVVFVFQRSEVTQNGKYYELIDKDFVFKNQFDQHNFRTNKNLNFIVTLNEEANRLFQKVKTQSDILSDYYDVVTGIKEYQIGKGRPLQTQEDKDLLRFNASYKKDKTFLPELRGKNINRYGIDWQNEHVSYGVWIAEPRDSKYFEGEKILVRQIPGNKNLITGYTDMHFIVDQSVFIAKKKIQSEVDVKYLLALLNSQLLFWFFRNENNEFDELFPKIKSKELKALPIKVSSSDNQQPFIAKADIMLSKNKELHELKQSLIKFLQAKHEGLTLSKKLADWPQLSFKDFLKELEKQKIKLSLSEQNEWLQYFDAEKAKAVSLQTIVNQTDKEIDQMVYALYGLTEEEIKIVEGN